MDSQQVLLYALELKSLLAGHGKIVSQVKIIDNYIDHLSRRAIHSDLYGVSHFTLHHLTKKSIAEGIRKIYHSITQKKWNRIQELSALIINALDSDEIALQFDQPARIPPRRDVDDLAPTMTDSFRQISRSV